MTVKFRDSISAKSCIIVSPPYRRCTPTSALNSPQAYRRCKAGASPVVEWKPVSTRANSGSNIQKEERTKCSETGQIRNESVPMIPPSGLWTKAKLELELACI
jgi:hypothetical protein